MIVSKVDAMQSVQNPPTEGFSHPQLIASTDLIFGGYMHEAYSRFLVCRSRSRLPFFIVLAFLTFSVYLHPKNVRPSRAKNDFSGLDPSTLEKITWLTDFLLTEAIGVFDIGV